MVYYQIVYAYNAVCIQLNIGWIIRNARTVCLKLWTMVVIFLIFPPAETAFTNFAAVVGGAEQSVAYAQTWERGPPSAPAEILLDKCFVQ